MREANTFIIYLHNKQKLATLSKVCAKSQGMNGYAHIPFTSFYLILKSCPLIKRWQQYDEKKKKTQTKVQL